MNCFKHEAQLAVGICKSCGKGLCRGCAIDLSNGLACRGSCEERVVLLNRVIDRSTDNLAVVNAQMRSQGLHSLILGLVFFAFGLWAYRDEMRAVGVFAAASGALIALYGVVRAFGRKRLVT